MSQPPTPGEPPTEGLSRLLEDLVRDGWLMGMNAGLDPAMARMDGQTGVFCRAYFAKLVEVAVEDAGRGRCRVGDGPEAGNVAVLAVRFHGWWEHDEAERPEVARSVAEALGSVLRADDSLGRLDDDTFALLLRGCPEGMLEAIERRCVEVVGKHAVEQGRGTWVAASSCVVRWDGEGRGDLLEQALGGLLQ